MALTNLVSLVLGFLWTIQFLYELKHFFIALVVATLLAFGLLIANICLMYGSHQRNKTMVLPWILAYSLSAVGLVLALILAFEHLGPFKLVAIPALLFLIYCIWVIVAFFRELQRENAAEDLEMAAKVDTELQVNVSRMIDEEEEEDAEGSNDDTFTHLPTRTPVKTSANPFRPENSGGVAANPTFKATFLPQPDEVIQIQRRFEEEPLLTRPNGDLPEATPSSSISTSIIHQRQRSLLTSEDSPDSAVSSRSKSHSHSALVDIDPSFTPFKRKDGSENMPKMKIFLPKHGDSSSEDDDSASTSSNGSLSNAEHNQSSNDPRKRSNEG